MQIKDGERSVFHSAVFPTCANRGEFYVMLKQKLPRLGAITDHTETPMLGYYATRDNGLILDRVSECILMMQKKME